MECNKPIWVRESVERGVGPICAGKLAGKIFGEKDTEDDNVYDLPFDNITKDIIFERRGNRMDGSSTRHFNIFQSIKHHSPTGFEWGYAGSGPADFALNIVELFLRTEFNKIPKDRNKMWNGTKVCDETLPLYQHFKTEFILPAPEKGTTIKGDDIRKWIKTHLKKTK